jgi:hypothetical protein
MVKKWDDQAKLIYKNISECGKVLVLYSNYDENKQYEDIFSPILKNIDELRKYEYVWVVKSDTLYTGDWKNLFDTIDSVNEDYDLIVQNFGSKLTHPNWKHWPDISSEEYSYDVQNIINYNINSMHNISANLWRKANLNVFRLSVDFLNIIYNKLISYKHHYECVVPTLAEEYGMKVADITDIIHYCNVLNFSEDLKIIEPTDDFVQLSNTNINGIIVNDILYEMEYCKLLNSRKHMRYFYKEITSHINNLFKCVDDSFIGSKEFCKLAKICSILDKDGDLKTHGINYDNFLTNKHIHGLGDYIIFLNHYISKYGVNNNVKKITESLIMNQIYSLTPLQKKHIEEELNTFKEHNLCNRILNRIFAQIQGLPDPYIIYEYVNDNPGDKYTSFLNSGQIPVLKYKKHPF